MENTRFVENLLRRRVPVDKSGTGDRCSAPDRTCATERASELSRVPTCRRRYGRSPSRDKDRVIAPGDDWRRFPRRRGCHRRGRDRRGSCRRRRRYCYRHHRWSRREGRHEDVILGLQAAARKFRFQSVPATHAVRVLTRSPRSIGRDRRTRNVVPGREQLIDIRGGRGGSRSRVRTIMYGMHCQL